MQRSPSKPRFRRTPILVVAALSSCLSLTAAASAHTGDQAATAQALFEEGIKLRDAGKHAEACPKFAASHRLDPAFGALYNLAECHVKLGLTASAWAELREASGMAKRAGQTEREEKAALRAAELLPKLVRLVVSVETKEEGIEVKRDGVVVDRAAWGTAIPVDPGTHTLSATAPGKALWSRTIQVTRDEGALVSIAIPPLAPQPEAAGPAGAAKPSSVQRPIAVAVAGVGVAGVVVGSVFGMSTKSAWDARKEHCNDRDQCDAKGIALAAEAKISSYVSTAAFAAGGACLAGAAVLWLTAKTRPAPSGAASLRAAPVVGSTSLGLLLEGTF